MGHDALFLNAFPSTGILPRTMGDASRRKPVFGFARYSRAFAFADSSRAARPTLQAPSLVSTFSGGIDTLLLTIPSHVHGAANGGYLNAYKSLLSQLPQGTKFIVVNHEATANETAALLHDNGHAANSTFVAMPDHINFSVWAEDGYVAVEDIVSGAKCLLEPLEFLRLGDALVADYVEEQSSVSSMQTPLIFQGGNCLVGDGFWLMGMDYAIETIQKSYDYGALEPSGKTLEELLEWVKSMFSRHVDARRTLQFVGTTKRLPDGRPVAAKEGDAIVLDFAYRGIGQGQPVFHIDMFVTLIGRGADDKFRLAVGSPRLAASVLGIEPYEYGLDDAFDDIADEFVARGFVVERIPLPLTYRRGEDLTLGDVEYSYRDYPDTAKAIVADLRAQGANEVTRIKTRSWYFATANNCLVQRSATAGDVIWMPTYGYGEYSALAATDAYIEGFWQNMGFMVKRLSDFNDFAHNLGAVHCIKKYISRAD